MAIRHAVSSGIWSSPLRWDGGTTLPGAGDIVYANGFTVAIDQDITVGALRNDTRDGHVANGANAFTVGNFTGTRTITANLEGAISGASQQVLRTANTPFGHLVINGNIIGFRGSATANSVSVFKLDSVATGGQFTLNGNVAICDTTGSISATYALEVACVTNFTWNGNLVHADRQGRYNQGVMCTTLPLNATINWNGTYIPDASTTPPTTQSGRMFAIFGIAFTFNMNTQGLPLQWLNNFTAASPLIELSGGATINSTITAPSIILTRSPIINAGSMTGNLVINADIDASNWTIPGTVAITPNGAAGSTLTINGDIIRSTSAAVGGSNTKVVLAQCATTLNGNVTAGYGGGISFTPSDKPLVINGNIYPGPNPFVSIPVALTGSSFTPGFAVTVNGEVHATDTATNGASNLGCSLKFMSGYPSAAYMPKIQHGVYGFLGDIPCNAGYILPPSGGLVTLPISDTSKTTLSTGVSGPYPIASNVRAGISYGTGLVGTCIIPPANTVSIGVPVDATTGTLVYPTANAIFTG